MPRSLTSAQMDARAEALESAAKHVRNLTGGMDPLNREQAFVIVKDLGSIAQQWRKRASFKRRPHGSSQGI